MAINITDSGSTVKLELTTGYSREGYNAIPAQVVYLSKSELDVKYIGEDIIIYDTGNSYKFLYTDITTPSPVTYTTPDAMAAAIEAFKETAAEVEAAPSENHIGSIGGHTAVSTATLTRPADTTAYAAKDVISIATSGALAIEFSGAGRVTGGSGYIVGLQIETDQTANVAQYKLHPFQQSPAVVIGDNSAYVEKFTDAAIRLTDIVIPALTNNGGASNTAKMEVLGLMIPYKCAAGSTSIFAQLETLTAFTPASAQIYKITLFFEQN